MNIVCSILWGTDYKLCVIILNLLFILNQRTDQKMLHTFCNSSAPGSYLQYVQNKNIQLVENFSQLEKLGRKHSSLV